MLTLFFKAHELGYFALRTKQRPGYRMSSTLKRVKPGYSGRASRFSAVLLLPSVRLFLTPLKNTLWHGVVRIEKLSSILILEPSAEETISSWDIQGCATVVSSP